MSRWIKLRIMRWERGKGYSWVEVRVRLMERGMGTLVVVRGLGVCNRRVVWLRLRRVDFLKLSEWRGLRTDTSFSCCEAILQETDWIICRLRSGWQISILDIIGVTYSLRKIIGLWVIEDGRPFGWTWNLLLNVLIGVLSFHYLLVISTKKSWLFRVIWMWSYYLPFIKWLFSLSVNWVLDLI